MNLYAAISLVTLIAVILLGFFRKVNVGLLAILAAALLGSALGLSDSTIINGFSASLFINLLGVSFLCSAAISNDGALETVSKKFLRLAGGRSFVAPIMIYVIGFAVAAIGPGCVPALGIVSALSLPLGKSTGYNAVMLAAFAAGIVLILFRAVDEQATLKGISWSTLLLVTGMGMLMEIVMEAGGVELLSSGLANVMNSHTAIAIQGLTAGIMSWFSSAIGVVWPTLIPTVSDIAQTVGVSSEGLITIMCLTASFAGLSPASTAGGLILAAKSTEPDFTKDEENKLFVKLFVLSVLMVLLIVLAGLLGLYSIL